MKKKNEGIQLLRALACLCVVWCHTEKGNGLGAFGVDYNVPYKVDTARRRDCLIS